MELLNLLTVQIFINSLMKFIYWLFFVILHFIICIIYPCEIVCIKSHRSCMVSVLASSVVDRGFEHRSCMVSVLAPSVVDRGFEHRSCMVRRARTQCGRSWVRASVCIVSVLAPCVVDREFEHRSCIVSVLAPSVVDRGFDHRSCMVSVHAPSVVNRGFEHRLCQTTDYKMKIFVASILSTQH